jgi:hypothetical protein
MFQEITQFERGQLRPEQLGLMMMEAKGLLEGLQRTMVEQQITGYSKAQSACPLCGNRRLHKGAHVMVYRTLFGKLELSSLRLFHCQCQPRRTRWVLHGRRRVEVLRPGLQLRHETEAASLRGPEIPGDADEPADHISLRWGGTSTLFEPQAEHRINWFQVSMRLTVMNQIAKGLGSKESESRAGVSVAKLRNYIKHRTSTAACICGGRFRRVDNLNLQHRFSAHGIEPGSGVLFHPIPIH